MPPLTVGTGITRADVEKRATYIALTTAENARMTAERDSTMRDYKNRLAALVVSAMRETALNTLTELKAKSQVQGELVRVVSAQSQMVAGTNYLIVAEVGAPVSVLTLKIFEQKWTSTLQLTAATRGEANT